MTFSGFLGGFFLFLGLASALVSVAGTALASDLFGKLLYGSILNGFSVTTIGLAVAIHEADIVTALQVAAVVVLSLIAGSVATHRIAAAGESRLRAQACRDEGEAA